MVVPGFYGEAFPLTACPAGINRIKEDMRKKMESNRQPNVNLNLNVRGMPLSATLRINEISNRLMKEGRQVFKLGLGQSPFPVPKPVENELKANAYQKDYLQVIGLQQLRQAVSDYFSRSQGVRFSADNIMIGPGSKELMFILQLVYYGDLMIPRPSWVSYAPQAHIIGRHIHWISAKGHHDWKLRPEDMEKMCESDPDRPRLIILNYPSNPHGGSYTVDELAQIAEVAAKYRILLLSDEIYGELHFEGRHVSIARFYPEGTIISSGLSKWCGAGGWRLGVFAFPSNLVWLRDAMATVASETYTSTSAPIQYAAVRAFEGGIEIENYLSQARRILRDLGLYMAAFLRKARVDVMDPEGAFYLFPDFGAYRKVFKEMDILTADQMCEAILRETGVALLPASDFGLKKTELIARLAYVDFDGARVMSAAQQIPIEDELDEDFLITYCPNCINAVKTLQKWLEKIEERLES